MAKKQNHWYILVFTNNGPKYVTEIGSGKTAMWDELGKPKEFTKEWAMDICKGLLLNLFNATVVCHPLEIEHQPYYYESYTCEFKEKEDK